MNKRILKLSNYVLSSLVGALGFSSCHSGDAADEDILCEYGCPFARYAITGTITDENGKPLEGKDIRVKDNIDYCVSEQKTDAHGAYAYERTNSPGMEKLKVVVSDPDSIYASDSTDVEFVKTKDGEGTWFQGEYSGKADFKLKKK